MDILDTIEKKVQTTINYLPSCHTIGYIHKKVSENNFHSAVGVDILDTMEKKKY